jgi:uncharacterized protein YbaA (DUF1428 family)
MPYVDGFVIPILKKNIPAYRKMAKVGGRIWRKYGALDYKECIGEDLKNEWGTPFPKMMKLKPGETVVFSYIVFKSRKHRDAVNAKVMKDPAMNQDNFKDMPMPFDVKRMVYGGFDVLVDA